MNSLIFKIRFIKRLLFSLIFITSLTLEASAQTPPKTQALQQFNEYTPKIEESHDMNLLYREAIVGDLNMDSLNDVIVEFGLGAKQGNNVIFNQAAIYLNQDGDVAVIGEFSPGYCINIKGINNGIVTVQKFKNCINPHPKVVDTKYYALKGDELVRIAYYKNE